MAEKTTWGRRLAEVKTFSLSLADRAKDAVPASYQINIPDAKPDVQQAGKGRIFLNMMNGEVPEVRDILFMVLATHPDNLKQKPELIRKVAASDSNGTDGTTIAVVRARSSRAMA